MKKTLGIAAVLLGLVAFDTRGAAQQTPDWGSGVAPFAFAFVGDIRGTAAIREAPFARLVTEINRDNDVDFVMHAGDIKAGSERCDDSLIRASVRPVPDVPAAVRLYARGQRVDGLSPREQRPVQPARAAGLRAVSVLSGGRAHDRRTSQTCTFTG